MLNGVAYLLFLINAHYIVSCTALLVPLLILMGRLGSKYMYINCTMYSMYACCVSKYKDYIG